MEIKNSTPPCNLGSHAAVCICIGRVVQIALNYFIKISSGSEVMTSCLVVGFFLSKFSVCVVNQEGVTLKQHNTFTEGCPFSVSVQRLPSGLLARVVR